MLYMQLKAFHVTLFLKWKLLGGEGRVVELLEDESGGHLRKPLLNGLDENRSTEDRSFCNFFWRPCKLGKDLLAIQKFGLVQYVSCWNLPSYGAHSTSEVTLMFLRYNADDSEDCLCIPSINIGTVWCLWWWGIQVVLRVCFLYKSDSHGVIVLSFLLTAHFFDFVQ